MKKHDVKYEFHSVFAHSISDYLTFKESLGEKTISPGNILRQFDRYCSSIDLDKECLTNDLIGSWLLTYPNDKKTTHSNRISVLRGFAKYLSTVNEDETWQPIKKFGGSNNKYVPYIYSFDEIKRIISVADTLTKSFGNSRMNEIFPAIIRMLYCCGLRLGEALSLKLKDVDLENGILIIRGAKFGKDRKIPISDSLLLYLRKYCARNKDFIGIDSNNYFFPTSRGEQYSHSAIYEVFRTVLWNANISHQGKGKGPRLHDFRHTFAVHSLKKSAEQGEEIYSVLTRLMVYLGHEKITSTEYYLCLTADVFPDVLKNSDKICSRAIPKVTYYEKE